MGLFSKFSAKIKQLFSSRKIDEAFFEELEDTLIEGDLGARLTDEIIETLRKEAKAKNLVEAADLQNLMKELLSQYIHAYDVELKDGLNVFMILGVNGVGKTTSIAKMAKWYTKKGEKVLLAAADTFRAAAVEQLVIWGERVGVPVVKQNMGSDPASVAYDTLSSAKANGADVVIIDTAGRLHNKINLMNELTKIKNVMKKVLPDAPNEILLVLDGSTGQNAFEQAKQFTAATEVNALAVTKLDGTAKGGVVIGISDHFKIPVKYIGLGEGMEDLQLFRRREFVNSLFGE